MNPISYPITPLDRLSWGDWIATRYNRVRLAVIPRAATPLIILGIATTILGTLGLITALTGSQIPHLEFIAKHIPASVALSLLMMRAGIHSINNGVTQARKLSRWRQEGMNSWMQAQLTQDPGLRAQLLAEAACCHWSLPPESRLDQNLRAGDLYGKMYSDVSEGIPGSSSQGCLDKMTQKWYDFWLGKQSALGKLDVAVGHLMLVAGITSLIFLAVGKGHLPSVLESVANDSYLSLSFSFLLFAYWLDCTKRGSRMQKFENREEKRANIELNLQAIVAARKPDVDKRNIQARHLKNDPRIAMGPHKESPLSSLAKPTLFVGGLITLLGVLYLCQCLTNSLPTRLDFLTENVPLSTLFATTLITTGFYAQYQGVSLLDKKHKKEVRRCTTQTAADIAGKLYYGDKLINNKLTQNTPSESLGTHALKWISVPGYILGAFLMLSGAIGVFAAAGLPISGYLSFITQDPSFSALFCVTTFLFGADAISNADRMRSYQNRKIFDKQLLTSLIEYREGLPDHLLLFHPPQDQKAPSNAPDR